MIDRENGNAIEMSQRDQDEDDGLPSQSPRRLSGWPPELGSGEPSPADRSELGLQMQELSELLRSVSGLYADNVSELGMALARLVALEAGFSELLRSEGGHLRHDD